MRSYVGVGLESAEAAEFTIAQKKYERLVQLKARIERDPSKATAIFNSVGTRLALEEVGVDHQKLALEALSAGVIAAIVAAIGAVIAYVVKVLKRVSKSGGGGGSSFGAVAHDNTVEQNVLMLEDLTKTNKKVFEHFEEAMGDLDFQIWVKEEGGKFVPVSDASGGAKKMFLSEFMITHSLSKKGKASLGYFVSFVEMYEHSQFGKDAGELLNDALDGVASLNSYVDMVSDAVTGGEVKPEMQIIGEQIMSGDEEIRAELAKLKGTLDSIVQKAQEKGNSIDHLTLKEVKQFNDDFEKMVKENSDIGVRMKNYVGQVLSDLPNKLEHIKSKVDESTNPDMQKHIMAIGKIVQVVKAVDEQVNRFFVECMYVAEGASKWGEEVFGQVGKLAKHVTPCSDADRKIMEKNIEENKEYADKAEDELRTLEQKYLKAA